MEQLPVENFERVRPLIAAAPMRGHLAFPLGVLEGLRSGQIFVDRVANPRLAVVCDPSGFFFAFGEAHAGPIADLVGALRRQPLSSEPTGLFGTSPAWDMPLRLAFLGAERALEPDNEPDARYAGGYEYQGASGKVAVHVLRRKAFEFHPTPGHPPKNWRERIPPGMRLEMITSALGQGILDGTASGGYGIDPFFIRVAGGPEAYAARGLGLALMEGTMVASLCGFCALGGGEAELELATAPGYRGRGLAVLVSAAAIEQFRERGWLPAYSCDSRNAPSISVAKKLGYQEMEEITGYRVY